MKIILDGMGGDNAPAEIVKGAVDALSRADDFKIVITGKQDLIEAELAKYSYNNDRIELINCSEIITNDDAPATAIRIKKDSSLAVAMDKLKNDNEVVALVSAGPTGAILSGGLLKVGRIKGISRPAICATMPSINGEYALLDCGANAECKVINMCHFAIMGVAYAKASLGIENPTVGLLNNGTEEHKGDELHQATFTALKSLKGINFIGNIEGRDLMLGACDVAVADGFSGNIALKSMEGCAMSIIKTLKTSIMASKKAKFGYLLMKKQFANLRERMDYNKHGGAMFIGCEKPIIKSHGSSEAVTISNAIIKGASYYRDNLVSNIKQMLGSIDLEGIENIEK